MPEEKDIYTNLAVRYEKLYSDTTKKADRIAWSRLITILVGAALIIVAAKTHWALLIVTILTVIVVFFKLVLVHLALDEKRKYYLRLAEINQSEKSYLKGQFTFVQNGAEYQEAQHPYALDLDIFGPKSIFHFINRAETFLGRENLAEALRSPSTLAEISQRQEAAQELAPQIDWRQNFMASISHIKSDRAGKSADRTHLEDIQKWLISPDEILPMSWLHWARYVVPPLTIALIALIFWLGMPLGTIIFVILIPGWILSKTNKKVSEVHAYTEKTRESLIQYSMLMRQIEGHIFDHPLLIDLQNRLINADGTNASDSISQLSRLFRQLDVRNNPFSVVLNLFGLWDIHYAIAIEKWKNKFKGEIEAWFDAIGQFDFLLSLANLRYNYPHWSDPVVDPTQGQIIGTEVKHPLIFSHDAVGNQFSIDKSQKVMLITGSNMAGKSTFLRAVGVNLVMAYMGAPVAAKNLHAPILQLFTSMRTKDDLHEDTSSFYAELKRLHGAIKAVEKDQDAFLLLDEILKGTNSIDRHTGARAIIEQIIENGQAAMVATHDLELAQMENESMGKVENWCFEVHIKDGKLDFDYLIKRGVCSSFNATYLMHEMGFKVDKKLRKKDAKNH